MKFSLSLIAAFATAALAAPSYPPTGNQPSEDDTSCDSEIPPQAQTNVSSKPPVSAGANVSSSAGCTSPVTLDAKTNVFATHTLHPNSFYRSEVNAAVGNLSDKSLAAAAAKVADVGTFLWL